MVLDEKGQSSAEIILLIGGILTIVLLVAGYITNITSSTQESLKRLLETEREYVLKKV